MTINNNTFIRSCLLLLTFLLISGCTTLDGPPNPDDPYESFNRSMFSFNETADKYALKPIAEGYNYVMPDMLNTGVSNFFSNIDDITVFFNQLLQFKIAAAVETSARFVFNTTIGLLGLIDVATDMDLPKHNEDFGQTLAVWGVPSGNYLVLPLLGPSTIRDTGGRVADWIYLTPVFDDESFKTQFAISTLKAIDLRAGLIQASNIIDETVPDKYAFIRDAWTQRREYLIHDGNPPDEFEDEDLFGDDDLFSDDDLMKEESLDGELLNEDALDEESKKNTMGVMDSEATSTTSISADKP